MIRRFNLTPEEHSMCMKIAAGRQMVQSRNRAPNRRVNRAMTDLEVHQVGVKGEWVYCREYLPVRRPVVMGRGDGGIYDYFDGARMVEIKTARQQGHASLILPHWKRLEATAILFETPSVVSLQVDLVGWVSADDFAQWHVMKDWGEGPTQVIERHRLRDIDELYPAVPR